MRLFISALLLSVLLFSVVSAETLTPAPVLNPGKWAVEGVVVQNANFSNMGNSATLLSYGAKGAYGLMPGLELDLAVGMGSSSNLSMTIPPFPPMAVEYSVTLADAILRYQLVKESASMPVDVTVAGGVRSLMGKTKVAGAAQPDTAGTKTGLGVIASKVMAPFIPYGSLSYGSTGGSIGTYSQIDITLGTGIAWSTQGMVLLEYTNQSMTPQGGSNYTSGQIGAGVLYIL